MSPLNAPPTTATGAARELAVRQGCGGSQPGRLSPRRAHHDQCHSEQGNDRVERSCRLDLGRPNQELSQREGEERADHVDRKDPSALRRLGLGVEPALGCDEEPGAAEADDRPQDQPGQRSEQQRHRRGRRDHHPSEGGIGADVPNPLDDRSAAQRGQR